jgi:hypothetical protein
MSKISNATFMFLISSAISSFSVGAIEGSNDSDAYAPFYDKDGLTITAKHDQDRIDPIRWNLNKSLNPFASDDKKIAVYTPKEKNLQTKEVAVLRDPISHKVQAVRSEEIAYLNGNEKLKATSLWGSLVNTYDSVVNPKQVKMTVYRMPGSMVVIDNAGKAEAVSIEVCEELNKDLAQIQDCSAKLSKIGKIHAGKIINPADMKFLKELSDDPEKDAKSSVASEVPKMINSALNMCDTLYKYARKDSESPFSATATPAPAATGTTITK